MPMGTVVVGPPKRVSAADRDDDERNRRGLRRHAEGEAHGFETSGLLYICSIYMFGC